MAEINTQRLDGYRRLIDIARDLASTLDLNMLLERIVRAAAEVSGSEAASILLYDDTTRQLYFQVATNIDDATMHGLTVPLQGSIAGWMVVNRKPVRIVNAQEDERFFGIVDQATGRPTGSLLGVPLITKNKVVGVLEALNKRRGKFTESDENMLSVLGSQAAVAIENARLFQQSDLIAEFIHELRSPLGAISTAAYLLQRPEVSEEQRTQIAGNMHNETVRLNAMTSAFLDVARLESGRVSYRKTRFNVAELLNECKAAMDPMAEQEKVGIVIEAPEGLPPLEADRDKIKQVAINLLSNAIKYNRPGGTVTVKVHATESRMCLNFIDTGMGIPESALTHLFEKFYRVRENESKAGGTGLGLSICRQIVRGHGGTIEVTSKVNVGTSFLVCLPRVSKTMPRPDRIAAPAA
jgi:signal transduction histidine kinase